LMAPSLLLLPLLLSLASLPPLLAAISIQTDPLVCNTEQLECGDGQCVPRSWACDGEADCTDGTDEKGCSAESLSTCDPGNFRCSSGPCIPLSWQCDGEQDCQDGLDEWPGLCKKVDCKASEFRCPVEAACIPAGWRCDGNNDCRDGADEADCDPDCGAEEFQCGSGDCVQARWVCDGSPDCSDRSDETDCSPAPACSGEREFQCNGGGCIRAEWRCDGEGDCADWSDERGCSARANSSALCGAADMFRCAAGGCVHTHFLCDGERDCEDGSDEAANCVKQAECGGEQYRCSSGECVPGHLVCSGSPECEDGSDEADCAANLVPAPACLDSEFHCGVGGACVPLERVCDQRNDCGDWQDEQGCACREENGGCQQLCHDSRAGHHCGCRSGYRLNSDNVTCSDVDECKEESGVCSQTCLNTAGGYDCACLPGYLAPPDASHSCRVAEGRVNLVIGRGREIRLMEAGGKRATSLVNRTGRAASLDYHYSAQQMFWVDGAAGSVHRASLVTEERRVVVGTGATSKDGLAVDWVHNLVWWLSAARRALLVTDLAGDAVAAVVTGLHRPTSALATHPKAGLVYWADCGAGVERASMAGARRETVLPGLCPASLALDLVRDTIYWVDGVGGAGRARLDGSQRVLLPGLAPAHPIALAVFEDWLYWTEEEGDAASLHRASKYDGAGRESLAPLPALQPALRVFHRLAQPETSNRCLGRPASCSHLCVPAGETGTACLCPAGLALQQDGATCGPVSVQADQPAPPRTVSAEPNLPPKNSNIVRTKKTNSAALREEEVAAVNWRNGNLYTGLVVGAATGLSVLVLLIAVAACRQCSKQSSDSLDSLEKSERLGRGIYTAPRQTTFSKAADSESMLPLNGSSRESPASRLEDGPEMA